MAEAKPGPSPPAVATRSRAPIFKPVAVTTHVVAMEGAELVLPPGVSNATGTGAEAETEEILVTSTGTRASASTQPAVKTEGFWQSLLTLPPEGGGMFIAGGGQGQGERWDKEIKGGSAW